MQKSARTVLEEQRLFCVGLLVMIKLKLMAMNMMVIIIIIMKLMMIIMKLLLMILFREELDEVAKLLGEEKRDGTCRVMTLGGRPHDHDHNHDNHDPDDDHHHHNHDHHDDSDDFSDEVIKETLKSKLSNMQLSNTAVEFLTN